MQTFPKVKVVLKVTQGSDDNSLLNVDTRRKQVTLFDPAACGIGTPAPEDRRLGVLAPKMFAFDAIFTDNEPKSELCATALTDVIHAVINGTDGCIFSFGHSRLGKSSTMIGRPDNLGVIPSAISWLFRCISEQKQKTGARFSVRVSAVEIVSPTYALKDLLSQHASECEQSPGIYLCEGALQNYCELRAPSPEKAAFYLDSALAVRNSDQSHLFYTLHVYQYSVGGKGGVAGGRSRLHLIDLGGAEKNRGAGGLPLSGIGNVLLAIFNGQKHVPHREHKLTQQLKECMGSLTCHAAMIAHVSADASNYSDTLTTIQLASRIHRMRRKRFKFMGGNPGAVGGEESARLTGSSDVDPSSSEQSADTVIYVGPTEETDGEHPPVYIPSLNSGDNRCAMNKALRGSLVDQKLRNISKSVPASPQRSVCDDKHASSHRKQAKPNSTKSSPVRQGKSTPTPREEQWVDGPRVLKSKVHEGRSIHMSTGREREKREETWVDGPRRMSTGNAGASPSGGSYGYMDSHKKSMIRKWVENQSVHISRTRGHHHHHHKEANGLKTLDDVRGRASGQEDEVDSISHASHPSLPVNKVVPLDQLQCTGVEGDYDEEMEVEIIEVEELGEPVPMQDCCLQVTEEDIALCMGEIENPLPEVDQDEHPLRILSQENLTVVSTFTDSLSIVNDVDRLFPRNKTGSAVNGWYRNRANTADYLSKKMAEYEALTELHDLYTARGALLQAKPVSRCQSLMLSELVTSSTGPLQDFDVNSIASEPAYLSREETKLCDNCKVHLEPNDERNPQWRQREQTRFQSFRKLTSISSLRHPDGASNPNLREVCSNREPGNGAEAIVVKDEDEEISMPPPLESNNLYTISREGFDGMKAKRQNGQDLFNGQNHDPGDAEKLDRKWTESPQSTMRMREMRSGQKFLKSDISSTRHRFFSPLYSCFSGHGTLTLEKRNQFQPNAAPSKSTNKSQAV
ncbi:microtubule motor activity [Nesidiocoris tenuis]|uniref:Microtubule motor activity n=1 Tax=Nesidiocoris tenuis TaxID=355587 RepID=A0ABN7ARH1_9HEMI|nr:microtubule motor activity [Nesidiocoris tenuis]